jgi:hypothetical protein
MRLLRSFTRRPIADRVLVAQAVAVHVGIAALLRACGLRRVVAWSASRARGAGISGDVETRLVWAVRTATCLVPLGRTCLTEALTVQYLLRRRSGDAVLRFGVAKPRPDTVDAHAWLETRGRILIGGETAGQYAPLERRREIA